MYIRPGADGSVSSASLWLAVNARMCCLLVCGLLLPSVYEKKNTLFYTKPQSVGLSTYRSALVLQPYSFQLEGQSLSHPGCQPQWETGGEDYGR